MRQFLHPNMHNFNCPICDTSKDAPVVLVPIPGTESNGNIQCNQVHSECYVLYGKMRDIEIIIEK